MFNLVFSRAIDEAIDVINIDGESDFALLITLCITSSRMGVAHKWVMFYDNLYLVGR